MSQLAVPESGSTSLSRGMSVLQSQRLSRSGLVYGSSFSRGSLLDAAVRRQLAEPNDMWYDIERFQLDHINEVLIKLNDVSLDDEIWGKIVVMERGKRIAKAYLRKTTIIVDGGDEEFDGKTLGFNYFSNPYRDEYTEELRAKIGDGVILKIDNQGNIKAMARGSTPVFVQGWREAKNACIPDKVVRMHGKLTTKCANSNDDDRIFKVFDMRRFKQAVERDPYESDTDAKNLLLKTCVRIALVKDGGGNDPVKTPCWFMVVNLVALDMLKTKLPSVCTSAVLTSINAGIVENRLSRILSQTSLAPPSEIYSNPALTQLLAAAVQANSQYGTMSSALSATSLPAGLNVEQIAKLASQLSITNNSNNISAIAQALSQNNGVPKRPQRRQDYIKSARVFSDSEDDISEAEPKSVSNLHTPRGYSESTTGSSSGISGIGARKERHKPRTAAKSVDVIERKKSNEENQNPNKPSKDQPKGFTKTNRPRLTNTLFENPNSIVKTSQSKDKSLPKSWKSCASTTSDYDSKGEMFDSGSWSSQSRVSSTNLQDENHASSPSVLSETENSSKSDNQKTKNARKMEQIQAEVHPEPLVHSDASCLNQYCYQPSHLNQETSDYERYSTTKLNISLRPLLTQEKAKPRRSTLPRHHASPSASFRIIRKVSDHDSRPPRVQSYWDHQRRHSEVDFNRAPVSAGTTVVASRNNTIGRSSTFREHTHSRDPSIEVRRPSEPNSKAGQLGPLSSAELPSPPNGAPPTAVCLPMQCAESPAKDVQPQATVATNHRGEPALFAYQRSRTLDPDDKNGSSRRRDQLPLGARNVPNGETREGQVHSTDSPPGHRSLQRNSKYRQNCRIQRGASGAQSIYEEPYGNSRQPHIQSTDSHQRYVDEAPSDELSMRLQARRARQLQQEQEAMDYYEQLQQQRQRRSSTLNGSGPGANTNGFGPTISRETGVPESPGRGGDGLYGRTSSGYDDNSLNRVQQRVLVFEQKQGHQLRNPKAIPAPEPPTAAVQCRTPTSPPAAPPTTATTTPQYVWNDDRPPVKMENHPFHAGLAHAPTNGLGAVRNIPTNPPPQPKPDDAGQPVVRNSELAAQAAAAAIWRRRRNGPWDQLLTRAQARLPNNATDSPPTETTHGYQPTWNRSENLPSQNTVELETPQCESRAQQLPYPGSRSPTTGATHLEIDDHGTIRRGSAAFFQQPQQHQSRHPSPPKITSGLPISAIPNTGSVRSLRDYYTELQARDRHQSNSYETHHSQLPSNVTSQRSPHRFQGNHAQSYSINNTPCQRFMNNVSRFHVQELEDQENVYEAPPTPPMRHSSIFHHHMTYS